MKYVSVDGLKADIKCEFGSSAIVKRIFELIDNQIAIERQGYWRMVDKNKFICSRCGRLSRFDNNIDDYCRYCGAHMVGDDDV